MMDTASFKRIIATAPKQIPSKKGKIGVFELVLEACFIIPLYVK